MKKLIAFFSFAFVISFAAHSQEQYVEVLVTDTVLAEPQEWTVYLNIEKQYEDVVMADSSALVQPSVPKIKEGTSLDKLKAIIKKFNGELISTTTISSRSPYSRYLRNEEQGSLQVRFKNRKSLEDFFSEISKLNDVMGQITSANTKELESFQSKLDAKLMNRSKQEAARLAQLSGRGLGNVISVSEVTESETGSFKQFLEMIFKYESKSEMGEALFNNSPDKIKLERSLKVRYELK